MIKEYGRGVLYYRCSIPAWPEISQESSKHIRAIRQVAVASGCSVLGLTQAFKVLIIDRTETGD